MAYAKTNFKTKKALRLAVQAGDPAVDLGVFQPGGLSTPPQNGEVTLEGPHYPEPHRWYARVQVKNGKIVKVLG